MTIVLSLAVMFAVLFAIIVIVRLSSKKPSLPGTTPVAASTPANWSKKWEKWRWKIAAPVTVFALLLVWWLNEPTSFSKIVGSYMFWSGLLLLILVWGLLIPQAKTLKETVFRFGIFSVGTALILFSFIPFETVKEKISTAIQTPSATQPIRHQAITVQIQPDKWKEMRMTKAFSFYSPGGWVEFSYPNGKTIRVNKGGDKNWDPPSANFKIKGEGPYIEFTTNAG